MNDYEYEETRREAAVALSRFSYVVMYALADNVNPSEARESLMSYIARGPTRQEKTAPTNKPTRPPGRATIMPLTIASTARNLLDTRVVEGPIIAYVRNPPDAGGSTDARPSGAGPSDAGPSNASQMSQEPQSGSSASQDAIEIDSGATQG